MVLPFALAAAIPATPTVLASLQTRFPVRPEAPLEPPDAILVPGGGANNYIDAMRLGKPPNAAGERVAAALELARRFPSAKLVLSGTGEPDPTPLLVEAGIERSRIMRETVSRNTFENAAMAAYLLRPQRGQRFVLVTSALHMPRSVGSYRAAGFPVTPYGVDVQTMADARMRERLWKEVAGLLFYRLTGRSDAFYPSP